MNLQERSDLVLTFTQVLHVNGQSTDDTVAAAERLSNNLGLHATIMPRWGELLLQATDGTEYKKQIPNGLQNAYDALHDAEIAAARL